MKRTVLPILLLASCFTLSQGQQAPLDTLVKRFQDFREKTLQEKIYAHLNQKFFLTGETLWFKVYVVDGVEHRPLDMSKVAYAEVLDNANFPVLQAKIKLTDARGNGSFYLPASLTSGRYKLRLYTSWMKNFSPKFYFDEVFNIVNPFVTPHATTKASAGYTIDLFPEGGNLVSGLRSKIAFHIHDESRKGANANGWVLNDQNDTIASFAALRSGIGHFYMTPHAQQRYRVVLATTGTKSHEFPRVHNAGYVMHLTDSSDFVRITVTASGVQPGNVFLFAHARQKIINAEGKPLQDETTFVIPKARLLEGIAHFTLFDGNLQPLCERLYFTYPERALNIETTMDQHVFSQRRKVSVNLITEASGSPTPANLSMSVYVVDSMSHDTGLQIYPYLWLTSDLTGRIESPEFYFSERSPAVAAAIDNLMLTHGWRRFDWDEVMLGALAIEYLPEVKEHIVTAKVTRDGQPIRGVFTYLGSPGKIIRAYGSWSNEQGLARFEIKDFHGPRRIIVQTADPAEEDTGQTGSGYTVGIADPFSALKDGEELGELQLPATARKSLVARSIAMQVQDIFYYEQSASQMEEPEVDSSAFYGRADATYYLDDYTRFPVMEEVVREYVPGVFVRKRKDGFHFSLINSEGDGMLYGDPIVLLDGVPVLDVDDIMQMDPLQVKKLEVVTRTYYLGQATFSGIVSYTTYNGDLGGFGLDPQALSLNYEGLQRKRKFFQPWHARENASDRMPDQRYLVHWQADINTRQDGTANVEFYTSDVPGQYRIVVEGLDRNGHSGSHVTTFTVKATDNQ